MTSLQIYIILKLCLISSFFGFVSFFTGALTFVLTLLLFWAFINGDFKDEEQSYIKFKYIVKYTINIFLLSLSLVCVLPTERDIVISYIVPTVANSELTKNIPDYIKRYIEKELKEDTKHD